MVFNYKDPFLCRVQRILYVRIHDSFAINKSGCWLGIHLQVKLMVKESELILNPRSTNGC